MEWYLFKEIGIGAPGLCPCTRSNNELARTIISFCNSRIWSKPQQPKKDLVKTKSAVLKKEAQWHFKLPTFVLSQTAGSHKDMIHTPGHCQCLQEQSGWFLKYYTLWFVDRLPGIAPKGLHKTFTFVLLNWEHSGLELAPSQLFASISGCQVITTQLGTSRP